MIKSIGFIFGDGPLLSFLIDKSKSDLNDNIFVDFKGRVPNEEIFKFYKNQCVDAFINLSKHEGLPVSVIEAMSYGIPAIATNVGATSELVNSENGLLLDEEFQISELTKSILNLKTKNWISKRHKAKETYMNKFNSLTNNKKLVEILKYSQSK